MLQCSIILLAYVKLSISVTLQQDDSMLATRPRLARVPDQIAGGV